MNRTQFGRLRPGLTWKTKQGYNKSVCAYCWGESRSHELCKQMLKERDTIQAYGKTT